MHDCGFTDFPTNAFVEGCRYYIELRVDFLVFYISYS